MPEPELMDTPAQVAAYVAADFSEPHQAVITRFDERFPTFVGGTVLDLGCGSGDVTARFALAHPECRMVGVDAGPVMLAAARRHFADLGIADRIELLEAHLPDPTIAAHGPFDAVISNSLLHHLADPLTMWRSVALARPRAAVLVQDLRRPEDEATLATLVVQHTVGADPVLVEDFTHSLRASYTVAEIEAQLAGAGLPLTVDAVGDRHVVVSGFLPA
ncbi:MAG: class I SAM-dependent methyltransferase [Actinomycetes bacterium]